MSQLGQNASVGPSWHVGFTPNSGRIAARQRTDTSGQSATFAVSFDRLVSGRE